MWLGIWEREKAIFFFDRADTNRRKTKTCELENLAITRFLHNNICFLELCR